jgi:hypothetical protein
MTDKVLAFLLEWGWVILLLIAVILALMEEVNQ